MRLIDAKAIEKQARMALAESNPVLMGQFLRYIRKQPTIDAVEVVRCKDCRFYEENAESRTRFCRRGLNYQYAVPDGFCSYGERKKR